MSKVKYTTEIFGPIFSDLVKAELDTRFSRQKVELDETASPLPFGLVLMKNEDGTFAPLTETAAVTEGENQTPAKLDGEACAVLISDVPASTEAQEAVAITGYAILNPNNLIWDKSVANKESALEQLAKRGLVLKTEAQNGSDE